MYKSRLQELCHSRGWELPSYVTAKDGLDHNPRFTATVTVNGISFDNPDECRSSKEAHNQAAKAALEHFTALKPPPQQQLFHSNFSIHSPSSSSTGLATRTSSVEILQPTLEEIIQSPQARETTVDLREVLQPTLKEIVQSPPARETAVDLRDDITAKEMIRMYKTQLQQLAQKRSIVLPAYSTETDGPPHARRFKSRVTFDGKTYDSSEYFSTVKEAEQAAAKVAFDCLSLNEFQEDGCLYKRLLHQFSQKEFLHFPAYNTAQSGLPHVPTFISTVEVGGKTFRGGEAKTKKLAENDAAKLAYNILADRRATGSSGVTSPGYNIMKGASEISSSAGTHQIQSKMEPNPELILNGERTDKDEGSTNRNSRVVCPGCVVKGEFNVSSPSILSSVVPHIPFPKREEEEKEDEENGKRYKCSSPFPYNNTSSPENGSMPSPSAHSEHSSTSAVKYEIEKLVGSGGKVLVFPHKPNTRFPDGVAVLPFSDEKWMAVRVDTNHSH